MKKHQISRRKFIALSGLGILGIGNLFFNPSLIAAKSNGYITLFNGKNLEGWHKSGGKWTVRDGAIFGEQEPETGDGGFLLTNQQFRDFELMIDLKPDWGPDSGVFIRTNEKGEGIQIYVDYHEHGNVGYIRGIYQSEEGRKVFLIRPYNFFGKYDADENLIGFYTRPDDRDHAWDPTYLKYSASPEEWIKAWKINEWNTMRIRCEGKYPRIKVWVNNKMIADFDGETCPNPRYDREKFYQSTNGKGSIGLQVHGGGGWPEGTGCRFKNIRVMPL